MSLGRLDSSARTWRIPTRRAPRRPPPAARHSGATEAQQPVNWEPYSPEDAARIMAHVRTGWGPIRCPCCGGRVSTGGTSAPSDSGEFAWSYRCTSCRRSVATLGPRQ